MPNNQPDAQAQPVEGTRERLRVILDDWWMETVDERITVILRDFTVTSRLETPPDCSDGTCLRCQKCYSLYVEWKMAGGDVTPREQEPPQSGGYGLKEWDGRKRADAPQPQPCVCTCGHCLNGRHDCCSGREAQPATPGDGRWKVVEDSLVRAAGKAWDAGEYVATDLGIAGFAADFARTVRADDRRKVEEWRKKLDGNAASYKEYRQLLERGPWGEE